MPQNPITNQAVFSAKVDLLEEILSWIHGCIEQASLDPKSTREMHLAMEEALMNILLHAYQGGEGSIDIVSQIEPGKRVTFMLKDRGQKSFGNDPLLFSVPI